MPPIVPRKRLRVSSPARSAKPQTKSSTPREVAASRKPTLFDDLDATATPGSSTKNSSDLLDHIDDSDDDGSSLSSLSDADFEDFPLRKKSNPAAPGHEDDSDDDDEDIEFEDVHAPPPKASEGPLPSGDLELTLHRDTRISLANAFGKKGPTKRERRVRIATHCVHVQCLLWHNAIRNAWLCDQEVQGIMLSHLTPRLWDDVDRWRRQSAMDKEETEPPAKKKKLGKQSKGKANAAVDRPSKDWGAAAERLERGVVDMSHGDPLFALMKALSSWWKKRFRVTAPGLRKFGYMSLERLDGLTKAFQNEEHDAERFGERIRGLREFREAAQTCSGSRDVGAQLFTALLRGLGLETRMVANLQPLGFGWNKVEEADAEKDAGPALHATASTSRSRGSQTKSTDKAPEGSVSSQKPKTNLPKPSTPASGTGRGGKGAKRGTRILDEDDSDAFELIADLSDEDSVIELPPLPTKKEPTKVYDKVLEFPHYWTEIMSPVTGKYLVVETIVKGVVGTNRDLIESLEPRGAKADRAKQVMAYVVGLSADGTAKDVTVRYLKRQMLPGRTKGFRMPVEKVPVYNRHGKVKRYELFDWFKAAMSGYVRGSKKFPITEADEAEDSTDLKPAKPEKKEVKEGEETLQYYKQSKEFVLERHLKREEALLPTAGPVRVFRNKGKGAETPEENVYLRSDVVQVKSAETWHKQGRAPLPGEQPLKRVPYRAATTNRRREIAEAEAMSGEKVLQGLYSYDQTDWIIPPPIENGIIPKNEYGNIDLFAEHMCPKGAVHVPFRGAVRVCKRLEIDYAEAVVDFEFGHRMAVPVIQGVVVAAEYYDQVMAEIAKDETERARKEDEKKRKEMLSKWRRFLMGLRIVERIQQDYGGMVDDVEDFGHEHGHGHAKSRAEHEDEEMAGGFLPEGFEPEDDGAAHLTSGFFPVVDEGGEGGEDALMVEHGDDPAIPPAQPHPTAQPKLSTKPKRKPVAKATSSRRRRRRAATPSDEDVDESVDESNDDVQGDSDDDFEP